MNKIFNFLNNEYNYQSNSINLIASENYPSTKVRELSGSIFNNKYGEGYPGKRYYAGNLNTDQLEQFVQDKVLEVFGCAKNYSVNVQTLSGSPANSMVYLSILNYGDTVLSLGLSNGGHLSHMHSTSNWNKFFKHVSYGIKESGKNNFIIDFDDYCKQISEHKPKLVILGFSSYPDQFDFKPYIQFAHSKGILVLADIAHISGLVATGQHPSPFSDIDFDGADFITTTTHKTFRGPRGALIFAKNYIPEYIDINHYQIDLKIKSLISIINKTVFPGTSGGPHFAAIAGIGQAALEILGEDSHDNPTPFYSYITQVINNAKALERGLQKQALAIITPTSNHMCIFKLPDELDSLETQLKLERLNIICNRNMIPFDTKSAYRPSGIRLGSPAITTRGADEVICEEIGILIGRIIHNQIQEDEAKKLVSKIISKLKY
jgi:glycine hydroxymethyltransferase